MKKISTFMIIAMATILVACEGSRTARMIDTAETAIEEHNNGDSTLLIILIILGIFAGIVYLKKYLDKN